MRGIAKTGGQIGLTVKRLAVRLGERDAATALAEMAKEVGLVVKNVTMRANGTMEDVSIELLPAA
jgi:hypothetical protein